MKEINLGKRLEKTMFPFDPPWKHQKKLLAFSDFQEGVKSEKWVQNG